MKAMPLREQPPRPSQLARPYRAAVRALRSARAASLTDAAAAAGCAPEQLRAELVHAIDRNTCAAAARAAALGDGPAAIRAAAAAHHMCPPSAAAALKDDPSSAVRVAAADLRQRCRNLAASADPYDNLAAAAAASHPPTLMRLACDALACEVAASNPACPQAGLWLAAERPGVSALAAAASNPQCPPLLLQRLASDPAGLPRAAAASNPLCGPLLLQRLASDEYWKVRAGHGIQSALPHRGAAANARRTAGGQPTGSPEPVAAGIGDPRGGRNVASPHKGALRRSRQRTPAAPQQHSHQHAQVRGCQRPVLPARDAGAADPHRHLRAAPRGCSQSVVPAEASHRSSHRRRHRAANSRGGQPVAAGRRFAAGRDRCTRVIPIRIQGHGWMVAGHGDALSVLARRGPQPGLPAGDTEGFGINV